MISKNGNDNSAPMSSKIYRVIGEIKLHLYQKGGRLSDMFLRIQMP